MARGIVPDKLPRELGTDAASRLNVKLLAHTQAVRVVPASRQLRTSRGTLRYSSLVMAHGAQARALPQFPASLCWRINHLQTHVKFRTALAERGDGPQRVAVVGAGLIGSELANDLALAGHHITLLDLASRPLAASLDAAQSDQLLAAWKALPIHFVGGVQVSRYIEPIGRQAATLAASILGLAAKPYQQKPTPLRVKTSSLPFTL